MSITSSVYITLAVSFCVPCKPSPSQRPWVTQELLQLESPKTKALVSKSEKLTNGSISQNNLLTKVADDNVVVLPDVWLFVALLDCRTFMKSVESLD